MPHAPPPLFVALLLSLFSVLSAWAQSGPEIHVEFVYYSIDEVPDGGTHEFVNVPLGESRELGFHVTNKGGQPLTGLALTLDGVHAQEYEISSDLPVTQLAPGAFTFFRLRITPADLGTRTAALHITSNDANESPYDINLTVECSTPEIRVETADGVEIPAGSSQRDEADEAGSHQSASSAGAGVGVGVREHDGSIRSWLLPTRATPRAHLALFPSRKMQ